MKKKNAIGINGAGNARTATKDTGAHTLMALAGFGISIDISNVNVAACAGTLQL